MASLIRWLHLSDFHVGKDDYAGRKMFDYIISHVKQRKAEGFTPDLIFVTGDLANKGLESEYMDFWLEFMEGLQATIGNGIADRTFVVPGNHDVDRDHNQAFGRDEMLDSSSRHFDPTEKGLKARQMLLPRFKAFNDSDQTSVKGAFANTAGTFSTVLTINGTKVGIAGINTAWLCKDDHDEKKLTPGKSMVEQALNDLKDVQLRIVLGHHPLDWLLPAEQKPIKTLFGKNAIIYLHGHLHEEWAEPTFGGGHQFLAIQCGAAFQAREREKWRNGLVWGAADVECGELRLQACCWIPDQQAWVPATEAFHESFRREDWWHYPLPRNTFVNETCALESPKPVIPANSVIVAETIPSHNLTNTYLAKLPVTSGALFGREADILRLHNAWSTPQTNVVVLTAWGGVGKTSLVVNWINELQSQNYAGATAVYAESFYSKGPEELQRTSADAFLTHALNWFGEHNYNSHSGWDKGLRLAAIIRSRRVLLILDGLESLQYPPGDLQGRLKDSGMQALLKELARGNEGLCVITSRLEIKDIQNLGIPAVESISLDNLNPASGAELLQSFELAGTRIEFEKASDEFKGHALALTLLGSYLRAAHDGDIAKRDHIRDLEDIPEEAGRQARRVMESYEHWLEGKPELELLRLLGLFDHPVDSAVLAMLRKPPLITGVTDGVSALTETEWRFALRHLRDLRLIEEAERETLNIIDCHPLIREHFGSLLRTQCNIGWKEAHDRLFHFYLDQSKMKQPKNLQEMEPIFRSIVHGCLSGNVKYAFDVYYRMVQRSGETNYCCKVLGAIGADLAVLSSFFEEPWTVPIQSVENKWRAVLINWAAFRLQSLGRTREAFECELESYKILRSSNDTVNTPVVNYSLCQLSIYLGELDQAVNFGRRGIAEIIDARTNFGADDMHSVLAYALYQSGDKDGAMMHFRQAELLQKKAEPKSKTLYSIRSYFFCEFLSDEGCYEDVYKRGRESLKIAASSGILSDIALSYLTIGRNALLWATAGSRDLYPVAEKYLNQAVSGLIGASSYHHLPGAFLNRAKLYRLTGRCREAWHDLGDMWEVASRGEMNFFLADFHLEEARVFLSEADVSKATDALEKAMLIVKKIGYLRRLSDIAEIKIELGNMGVGKM